MRLQTPSQRGRSASCGSWDYSLAKPGGLISPAVTEKEAGGFWGRSWGKFPGLDPLLASPGVLQALLKMDCQGLVVRLIQDFVLLTTAVEVAQRWRELAEKLAKVSRQQMDAYEAPHRDKTGTVDSEVRAAGPPRGCCRPWNLGWKRPLGCLNPALSRHCQTRRVNGWAQRPFQLKPFRVSLGIPPEHTLVGGSQGSEGAGRLFSQECACSGMLACCIQIRITEFLIEIGVFSSARV